MFTKLQLLNSILNLNQKEMMKLDYKFKQIAITILPQNICDYF